jgi:acetyl esterase/lipase
LLKGKKQLMKSFHDLAYVSAGHPRQQLDLFLPEAGEIFPLIIWVHGGAFRMGSKTDDVPLEYLEHGFAVASLNYRLSQHAIFPAQIEDVKVAVRWLRAHAEQYQLDPSRFGAWGASAGGHLVTLLGLTGNTSTFNIGEYLDISSQVQAVVDHFGPTDFLQMDTQRLPEGMIHDPPDSPESELVGGAIQEHPDRVAEANPINYVTGDAPPFLIVHGDHDPLVPYQQSVILNNALVAQGVSVSFYTVIGAGHGDFQDPQVAKITLKFFELYLKLAENGKS